MAKPVRLSREQARLVVLAAQGLAAPGKMLVPTLGRTGFVRTLGGVDAYVAMFARVAGLAAADVHAAVAAGDLRVTPAVRGCIYVVPGRDAATAMKLAGLLVREARAREFDRAGIQAGELERLIDGIVAVLEQHGPLSTDALKRALPGDAVRALGDRGKKVGISSTLPPALRVAELADRIARTPEDSRLDSERYLWRVVHDAPPPATEDLTALLARIGEIFFRAAGLSTLKVFADWAGVPQRDAAAALERLDLVDVEIAGDEQPRRAFAAALDADVDAARRAVAFLPFEDNVHASQGGPALFVDAAHHAIELLPFGGMNRPTTLGDTRHLGQRSVVADGRMVGFWEYDPDARAVVHGLFDDVSAAAKKKITAVAAELGRFLRDEVGHGRGYSLDTDAGLRVRTAWVRAQRGGGTRTRRTK